MGNFAKTDYRSFLARVSDLLEQARRKTVRQVNTVITYTYWKIGKLVVEEEQRGANRAQYGEHLLQRLARDLTKRFGKGFTETNLKYIIHKGLNMDLLDSYTRTWIDRSGFPYKYEFRGEKHQGYYNPNELLIKHNFNY